MNGNLNNLSSEFSSNSPKEKDTKEKNLSKKKQ